MRRLVLLTTLCAAATAGPAAAASAYDAADLKRKLAAELRHAGKGTTALVRELDDGRTLYQRKADLRRIPASVEKLFTTSTALLRLGPGATMTTRVLRAGEVGPAGVLRGDLHLAGGGDPTFGPAAARRLAERVEKAGIQRVAGSVVADESWFDRRRGGPRTRYAYDSDMGGVLSAVAYRRGFSREGDPALDAAQEFAKALRRAGVSTGERSQAGPVPADAPEVARAASPPMRSLAAFINAPSDNFAAEMLLKHVGAQAGTGGTTARGARVARTALGELGLSPTIRDGSGLSRANRTSARQVVRLLQQMDGRDEGGALRASLAVAGRSGTLRKRMRGTAAQGRCQAKTGTLRGVSTLAGYCTTRGGDDVAFAFLANNISPYWAKKTEDRMTAAIARVDEDL